MRARGTVKPSRVCFLARWPSRKAVQHARARIRQITGWKRLLMADEWIVEELNWFLRDWRMSLVTCASPDNLRLITLCGIVIAPRPFRSCGHLPNADGLPPQSG